MVKRMVTYLSGLAGIVWGCTGLGFQLACDGCLLDKRMVVIIGNDCGNFL